MVADNYAHIAASQYGLVTRSQLLGSGLTHRTIRYRVRTGRLLELHADVFAIAGSPPSWHRDVLAACLTTEPNNGCASHITAGRLWGLDAVPSDDAVHITVNLPFGRTLWGVVVHHTIADLRSRSIDAIPVTNIEQTLMDLCSCMSRANAEYAMDSACRRRLTNRRRLELHIEEFGARGRPGTAVFRELIAERSSERRVPESALERKFLRLIRAVGLPEPEMQYPVRIDGRLIARIDFAWPDQSVFVEVDGERHHTGGDRWQRDLARQNRLAAVGMFPLRYTWTDLRRRPHDVVTEIISQFDNSSRLG